MTTVHVRNGTNLSLLGPREPQVRGTDTLGDLEPWCSASATALGWPLLFDQTDCEGELVTWVQECGVKVATGQSVGTVLNAGALRHMPVATGTATGTEH